MQRTSLEDIFCTLEHISGRSLQAATCERTPFVDLGLGSAQLMELVVRLRAIAGPALSVTAPWEHPTPWQLARHLDAMARSEGHADVRSAEKATPLDHEPIALVAMSCRLPGGVDSPRAYWKLLCAGKSGVGAIPATRWDAQAFFHADRAHPGTANSLQAGMVEDVAGFDAEFFSIAPREARQMDPQQRLALELAWEAFEDLGQDPRALHGADVGVFVGAMATDYAELTTRDRDSIDQHTMAGLDTSIAAARISYFLGLHGPSLLVNTACSSSLVAVQMACESIRRGECAQALAGGVHLMMSPKSSVMVTKLGVTNPAGQCRPFDADAQGYVRGEGGGMVLLKPLRHALRDGDRIYCVIRGGAINNNGASNGLTAPNPEAQEAVIRRALAAADVDPGSVAYVETHGPGTLLGDPMEAAALGAVFAPQRGADTPLWIGSVKSNLGHLEPASGIAGLMKVALAVWHRALPPTLHFERPNPHIAFDALRLRPATALTPWPSPERPARAGVSSFGYGGTNCHLVVESAPYGAAPVSLAPVLPTTTAQPPKVVFVCPGYGAQWLGMARQLMASEATYCAEIEACDRIVARREGWSPRAELWSDSARFDDAQVLQVLLVCTQLALAAQWRAYGIVPDVVVGHSLGEISAACLAGALTREGALRVASELGRLVQDAADGPDGGCMLLVAARADEPLTEVTAGLRGVEVAIFASARSVVLSGGHAAVQEAEAALQRRGLFCERVNVPCAAHSAWMDPLLAPLQARLVDLVAHRAEVPLWSTARDGWLQGTECTGDYWALNLRQPVRFAQAIEALAAQPAVFLEISAHPIAMRSIEETLEATGLTASVLPSCRRGTDDRARMHESLAALRRLGVAPAPHAACAPRLALVSGKTQSALRAQSRRLAAFLKASPQVALADVVHSLAVARHHFAHRATLLCEDVGQLQAHLSALARGETPTDVRVGEARGCKLAFVFTGQGSQRFGMGQRLHAAFPVFRDAFAAVAQRLDAALPLPLTAVLLERPHAAQLARTDFAQCALFALEVALFRLLESWGVCPSVVMGHSIGELVAAHVAGVWSLDDACTLVAARARLMQEVQRAGGMLAVEADEAEAVAWLAAHAFTLDIAALNGPRSTVLSGDLAAIAAAEAAMGQLGRRCKRLQVSHAFHSRHMDGILEAFTRVADGLRYAAPRIPIVSNETGQIASAEEICTAAYWARQVRQCVRFAAGVATLAAEGVEACLELGPDAVLSALGEGALPAVGMAWVPSLRHGRDAVATLLSALGALHVRGVKVDWPAAVCGLGLSPSCTRLTSGTA